MPETTDQIDYTPTEYHLNPYRNTAENVWLSMSQVDGDDEVSKAEVESWLHAPANTPPYKPLYVPRAISPGWYKDLIRFATKYKLHECLKRLKYWHPQNKHYLWSTEWRPDIYDKIKSIYTGAPSRSRTPYNCDSNNYAMSKDENDCFLDDITVTTTTTTESPHPFSSSSAITSQGTLQPEAFSPQCHLVNVSLKQHYWYRRDSHHRKIYAETGFGPPPKSQYPTRSYSPPLPPPEPRRTDCNCETGFTNSVPVHAQSVSQCRAGERTAAEQRSREDKAGRARERERRDRARSEERRQAYISGPYDYGGGGNGE